APIAVSEGAVTFACDAVAVERVGAELGGLGHLGVRSGCALVGLIGGDPAAALTTLAAAGLTVRCAGVGADGATVAAVVDESALAAAAFALHARFCAAEGA
ncbi:MAG: hypothetical protein KDE27_25495, partial [Planctomycetes bacterium]|nr:hypothetical protein [Planctomycetota bacterium]